MGSTISIVNDTPDMWTCKVGPDEAALSIGGTIIGSVGEVLADTATPVTFAIGIGLMIGGAVMGIGQIDPQDPANALLAASNSALAQQDFHTILPRAKFTTATMSLSMWRQGTCVRIKHVDSTTVQIDTLYMRPIFSGATDGSTIEHSIQWWLNKWPTDKKTFKVKSSGEVVNSGGTFMLRSAQKSSLCVDDGGNLALNMHLWTCDKTNVNQLFKYDPSTRLLRSATKDGYCVDDGGATYNGQTKLRLYRCDVSNHNQIWEYDADTLMFRNPFKNNLCMDDGGATYAGQCDMQLWSCVSRHPNQSFFAAPI